MIKTVKRLINLLSLEKRHLYISILLSFLDSIFLIIPIVIGYMIIREIPELNSNTINIIDEESMIKYTIIMAFCILLRILFKYLIAKLRSGAGYICISERRKELGKELSKVPIGYLNNENSGNLIATITSDAAFLEIEGMGVLEKLAIGIPSLIIGIGILLFLDYRIAIVITIFFIPTYLAYIRLAGTQDRYKIDRQNLIGKTTEEIVDFIKGIHILKNYNMIDKEFFKLEYAFEKLRRESVKMEISHIFPLSIFQLNFRIITTIIIFLAAYFTLDGQIDYTKTFLLLIASISIFAAVEAMGVFTIFSKMTERSLERMEEIDNVPKMKELSGSERLEKFDIEFSNVSFGYDKKLIIDNINFKVLEKTTTALIGLSGSGKTTIMNLIARFWDIENGEILIGGKNIKDLNYNNLLENISFVFQDVFLFNDTVLNNIRIGNSKASIEEVYEASKIAGCHEFIKKLEKGYDTIIGEGGSKLSGGEKQRISIARALIKNAPIVLLDEVTANLDQENEMHIQKALARLLKDRTVIMIAHKLSTIRNVDQIIVIDEGKIKQRGLHEELIKEEGLYKRLWDIQYRGEKWKV